MNKCRKFEKQLVAYLDGELESARIPALEEHLQSCEACRIELDALRDSRSVLGDALSAAPAPEVLSPWRPLHRPVYVPRNLVEKIWYSPQFKSALATAALASLFLFISGSIIVYRIVPRLEVDEDAYVPVEFKRTEMRSPKKESPRVVKSTETPRLRSSGIPAPAPRLTSIAIPKIEGIRGESITVRPSDGLGFSQDQMTQLADQEARPDFNTEQYDWLKENAFQLAMQNPLSTFSIDVDRAAYANVRRFLNEDRLPPPDAVRIEEMVNYFDYDYPQPQGEDPFAVTMEVSECPWNPDHRLAMVGLQGLDMDRHDLPPNNLVFLLDVSGSMDEPKKLPLLQSAMRMLVNQLRPQDRVSIVVYAGAAGLVLEPTSDKALVSQAIDQLRAGGSTAGGAGIELAYKLAGQSFIEGGNNRVILATDGDFNVGTSSDGELVRLIEEKRRSGVYLTVLGFGSGNLKDSRMEKLADKGNGNYAYIDDILEARKVLVNEMGGTLHTIARDVKIQIEFNPSQVKAYRLIGYENRMLASEDFDDDRKDAGELGAGHSVTALYELIPAGSREAVPVASDLKYQRTELVDSDDLMTLKLRYKKPGSEKSRLLVHSVSMDDVLNHRPSSDFRFASEVAEFGLLLRNSAFKGNASYARVIERASASKGEDDGGYRAEFIRLVEKAQLLDRAE